MKFISPKIKQFLLLITKLLVVGLAFYFIKSQLSEKEFNWEIISESIAQKNGYWYLFFLLVLTFLNRFIEILKWQNLAQTVRSISVWESTQQVLSAITLGIFTPNGIGEYVGKALFYKKDETGKIILLNMICNGVQVLYAVSFGLAGVFYINSLHGFLPTYTSVVLLGVIVFLFVFFFALRKVTIKTYSLELLLQNIRQIPQQKHLKNCALALLRYLVLLHQYVLLYHFFHVEISYFTLIAVVAAVYLLASSLPNFQALDFALKGSVAIYLFGFFGVDEWVVTIVATLIWILNLVIPISIGSIFVLLIQPKKLFQKNG